MPPNPAFPVSDADKNLVLHAKLIVDMCADSPERNTAGTNMYVTFTSNNVAVQRARDALKDGGEIYMPLEPSFFAALHGSLRDK